MISAMQDDTSKIRRMLAVQQAAALRGRRWRGHERVAMRATSQNVRSKDWHLFEPWASNQLMREIANKHAL